MPQSPFLGSRFVSSPFLRPQPRVLSAPTGTPTVTYVSQTSSGSGATSYTFSSVSLPSADATRHIIVSVHMRKDTATSISSVTVNGVAATQAKSQAGAGGDLCELWIAAVPSGETGDIVVALGGGAAFRLGVGWWRTYSLSSATPTDTAASTADPADLTIDCDAGGIIVAAGFDQSAAANATWANLTEQFDAVIGTANCQTGASDAFASAQVALAVSCNWGTPSNPAAVAAAFR